MPPRSLRLAVTSSRTVVSLLRASTRSTSSRSSASAASTSKPMLLAIICMLLVVGFFWAAFNKPKLVPGRLQSVGEIAYTFVARRSPAR